jgi:translation initiation factor 3 subunit C
LNQQLAKIKAIGEGVPNFYVRVIVQLEQAVETTLQDKDKVKKMSKTNAKSLNAMKQNIRKNNANFEAEIAALGDAAAEEEVEDKSEDESGSSDSSESESESESESDSSDDDKKKKKNKDDSSGSGSDDDDESDWGSDSSSSSSEDEAATKGLTGMSKWMKSGKADDDSDDEGFKEVKKKEVKQPRIKEEKEKVVVQKEEFVLSEENVSKKMEEIMAMRGKKGTSKRDQIAQLELLATAKIPPAMTAQVLVALISAQVRFKTPSATGVQIFAPSCFLPLPCVARLACGFG